MIASYSVLLLNIVKNATDFINDLLDGSFQPKAGPNIDEQLILEEVAKHYDFSQDDLKEALFANKEKLEQAVGVPLTPEQLEAISGGKTKSQKITSAVSGGIAGGATLGILAVVGLCAAYAIK